MGHGILLSGGSDVDFTIHGVFQYSFFGHPVWITTSHVCILIVMLLLIAFAIAANRCMAKASEVPGSFQNVVEMIVEMLDNMVSGSMGQAAPKFFNYIGTIFIFILVSNISGLLGLRPPTADYGVTLPLAILTFSMIHYNKWKYQKPMTIWTDLCSPLPPWLPIWLPIPVIAFVCKRSVGNGHDGIALRAARMGRHSLARSAACVFRSVLRGHSDVCVLHADHDIHFE